MDNFITNISSITINGNILPRSIIKHMFITQQTRELSYSAQAGRYERTIPLPPVDIEILLQLPRGENRNLLPQFWPDLTSNKMGELFFSGETNLIHTEKVKYGIKWLDYFNNEQSLAFATSWTKLEGEIINSNLMQIRIRLQTLISCGRLSSH